MESMKRQTGDQNPADFLAHNNDLMAKAVMENQLKVPIIYFFDARSPPRHKQSFFI